ncbi:MAG: GNAT family N-acetyltransferase [Caldilineales bacterium]|nr:GNAT family N-acetyltransferase [Caldilineales bacterium]
MNAQLIADTAAVVDGIRPLNPQRDLRQVADLIEEAFAGELEAGGLAALRDMRLLSHMGPLVGLMARSDPLVEDVLGGFVWVSGGQVVGNVTLQRIDSAGSRWQIANVAVARSHRGQGIGRALMEAALERIAERRGSWAVLQVRADNAVALQLYQSLGFEVVTHEVVMQLERVRQVPEVQEPPAELRPYHHSEWQARYELECAAHTSLDQWWRPVRPHQFWESTESRLAARLWELLGRNRVRRWVVPGRHGLQAWLSVDARRWDGIHRLQITVHPAHRGELEEGLTAFALRFLAAYPRWPVRIEQHGHHPELVAALQRWGFATVRHHLAMRRRVD